MPIYEFFCDDCNTVFNFYSPTINTSKIPSCPKCKKRALKRLLSKFATLSSKKEEKDLEDLPFDESKMKEALQVIEKEMGTANEDDPRQMARLLKKMNQALGGKMPEQMKEAIARIEAGDDPEEIEAELTEDLNPEDIFSKKEKRGRQAKKIRYDETLYEL